MRYKILAILVISTVFRLIQINDSPFWIDEVISLVNGAGISIENINENGEYIVNESTLSAMFNANLIDDGGNGIIHSTLIHFVHSIFGGQLIVYRYFEVGIYILTFLVFYLFLKKYYSENITQISLLVFSIHPLLLFHNREVRGYSLAVLIAILLFWAYKKLAHKTDLPRILIFSLIVFLSFFTHFLLSSLVITLMLYWVFQPKFNLKKFIIAFSIGLFTLTGIYIWYVNGGQIGIDGMNLRNQTYIEKIAINHASKTTFVNFMKGVLEMEIPFFGNLMKLDGYRNRAILILSLPILILLFAGKRSENRKIPIEILLAFTPLILGAILAIRSGHITSFNSRYAVWSIPFIAIFLAQKIEGFKNGRFKIILLAVIISVFGISNYTVINNKGFAYDTEMKDYKAFALDWNSIKKIEFYSDRQAMLFNFTYTVPLSINQQVNHSIETKQIKIIDNLGQSSQYDFEIKQHIQ